MRNPLAVLPLLYLVACVTVSQEPLVLPPRPVVDWDAIKGLIKDNESCSVVLIEHFTDALEDYQNWGLFVEEANNVFAD